MKEYIKAPITQYTVTMLLRTANPEKHPLLAPLTTRPPEIEILGGVATVLNVSEEMTSCAYCGDEWDEGCMNIDCIANVPF